MKKALILGVTGQDGSYLAKLLLDKGYEVFGGTRDEYRADYSNVDRLGCRKSIQFFGVDLIDYSSINNLLKKLKVDEVYNLAGQTSVGLSFEKPFETFQSITYANLNLLECIKSLGYETRLYNACSSECYGNTDQPANEETAFRPRSPYAAAKSAAFWQVSNYREAYKIFAASGILFNHESSLRSDRFVTKKIINGAKAIAEGKAETLKLGNTEIQRDWGWAPEYVEAMWRILQHNQPEDFVIATGSSARLVDFVDEAFKYFGLSWKDHVEFDESFVRPTDLKDSFGDPSKAKRLLGWEAKKKMADVVELMCREVI